MLKNPEGLLFQAQLDHKIEQNLNNHSRTLPENTTFTILSDSRFLFTWVTSKTKIKFITDMAVKTE